MKYPPRQYPDDEILIELMEEIGTFSGVAERIGKAKQNLLYYCSLRPHLKKRMDSLARKQSKWSYPGGDDLARLMCEHGSIKQVSIAIGIPLSTLWWYVRNTPDKLAIVREHQIKRSPRSSEEAASEPYRQRYGYTDEERAAALEASRRWTMRNKEKRRLISRNSVARRRARTKGMRVPIEVLAVLCNDPCSYCESSGGTIDHIDPLVANGVHSEDNLTSACSSCNSKKSDRDLLTFLLSQKEV